MANEAALLEAIQKLLAFYLPAFPAECYPRCLKFDDDGWKAEGFATYKELVLGSLHRDEKVTQARQHLANVAHHCGFHVPDAWLTVKFQSDPPSVTSYREGGELDGRVLHRIDILGPDFPALNAVYCEMAAAQMRLKAAMLTPSAAMLEKSEGTGGTADAKEPLKRSRKGVGGRSKLAPAEEKKRLDVLQKWWTAQGAGVKQKKFCRDESITVKTLHTFVNWHGARKSRTTNSG